MIAEGEVEIMVEHPENTPFIAKSRVLIFNGGSRDGVTTLHAYSYLPGPLNSAIVTAVKVKKVRSGRYGTQAKVTIPRIADGYGSIVSLSLRLNKKYAYMQKQMSALAARCPDGRLLVRANLAFGDGTRMSSTIQQGCSAAKAERSG